jgi:membrane protease subunit (stomatin/prohibitin family)
MNYFGKGRVMKKFFMLAITSLFVGNSSLAADASCEAQASDRKLAGAAKTNFVSKCNLTATSAVTSCEGQATTKKLGGAAKTSFIRKCYEGSQVPVPKGVYCESVANEKRLKASAKTSFVKKCIKGGVADKKARK